MTIQRYEIDIERDEDEQGNPESILAPYRHDKGDWCKAGDVDALEAEMDVFEEEAESLEGDITHLEMVVATQAAEIERLKADAAKAFYKLGNGEWTTLAPSERGDK